MVARLAYHLPRGQYLRHLATGLVQGAIGYAISATAGVRQTTDETVSAAFRDIQVAINNTARSITGHRRLEHVKTEDLLWEAGLLSYNAMATRAVALETWKAYHSCDGPHGARSPLGALLFDKAAQERVTRSGTAGVVPPCLPMPAATMVHHALTVWNRSEDLRSAKTIGEARSCARKLARSAPL